MTAMLFAGAGFGLGVLLLWRGIVPARPDVLVHIGRFDLSRSTAELEEPTGQHIDRIAWWKLGRLVNRRVTRYGWDLSKIRPDLTITDTHIDTFLGRLVGYALVGLLAPAAFSLLTGGALVVPLIFGVVIAAAVMTTSVVELRRDATRRRARLMMAVSTYLNLIAMNLAGGRGVPEALARSAELGTGWAFTLITERMDLARDIGQTPWQALKELGDDVGLSELTDLGSALTLVGDSGSRVKNTLIARAGTMQQRALAEEAATAVANEESIKVALGLMAAGFIVGVGYPMYASIMAL